MLLMHLNMNKTCVRRLVLSDKSTLTAKRYAKPQKYV